MSRMDHLTDTVLAGIAAQNCVVEVLESMGLRLPAPAFLVLARCARTYRREIFVKDFSFGASRANMSYAVEKLQRVGLVELTPAPHDRRRTRVRLTQKGRWAILEFEARLEGAPARPVAAA